MISMRKKYVATSGWRGYMTHVNAVAGANDTGSFYDSPCPSNQRETEVGMAKRVLRKARIPFRTGWVETTNVFCQSQEIVVAPENVERAVGLLKPLVAETRLLFVGRGKA